MTISSSGDCSLTGSRPAIVGMPRDIPDGPGPEVMAASTLDGNDVINGKGDNLGSIKEIMLDVLSGRVAYAVLSSGGLLGIGDKLFAIPWRALTLDVERKCFILDIDAERLKAGAARPAGERLPPVLPAGAPSSVSRSTWRSSSPRPSTSSPTIRRRRGSR